MPTTPVTPYVPQYITVHLGAPSAAAENVTVSFPEYVKNVASSEIYPTWEPGGYPCKHPGDYFVCPQPGIYRILPQPRLPLQHHRQHGLRPEIHQRAQHF